MRIPPLPDGPLFATNDLPHEDPTGADPDRFDDGLVQALQAWMRSEGLDQPAHLWFDPPLTSTTEHTRRIDRALSAEVSAGQRLIWTGGHPLESPEGITLHALEGELIVGGRPDEREWLLEVIDAAHPSKEPLELADAADAFPGDWSRYGHRWDKVRHAGMLLV